MFPLTPAMGYVAGAVLAVGLIGGWKARDFVCDAAVARANAATAKRLALKQEEYDLLAGRYNTLAGLYEGAKQQLTGERRETTNTVREIYRNVPPPPTACVPPADALKLLDFAQQRADAAAKGSGSSGQPDPAMSSDAQAPKSVR